MLNRLPLVGSIGGMALAFAYDRIVTGCGTFLGTGTELFAWSIVAKLFGGMFADRKGTWLVVLIAVLGHGLVLFLLSWAIDRKCVNKTMRVRISMLAILLALYACSLFLALPLSECP